MDHDNEFIIRPGRMASDRKGFRGSVIRAVHLARAGGAAARSGRAGPTFNGKRLGRGNGAGAVLASRKFGGPSHRRVMVKVRIVKLRGTGRGAAAAHLRYVQRDGVTRSGDAGELYDIHSDKADGRAFLDRADGDHHQFRFIVSPEDGAQYEDLKSVTRRLMSQMETDLGTKLDWVAIDHFNTGHPHTHILIRGKDDHDKDLVIARSYITDGIRERASDIVSFDLGPRTALEIEQSLRHEMTADRFTSIDRWISERRDDDGRVRTNDTDPERQSLISGRLKHLERLELATPDGGGTWRVNDDLEPSLRQLGRRGDIINSLRYDMAPDGQSRLLDGAVIHDAEVLGVTAGRAQQQPTDAIIGRLVRRGLYDEFEDRHCLVIDGADGRVHVVDIGPGEKTQGMPENAVLRIEANMGDARPSDRTVADIVGRNQGYYSEDIHRRMQPDASDRYITAHVRRLEAVRRAMGGIERMDGGVFAVGDTYLEKAMRYEQQKTLDAPVSIEVLSPQPVKDLTGRQAYTWLDQQLIEGQTVELSQRGFGEEMQDALRRRYRWLQSEGLVQDQGDGTFTHDANLKSILTGREVETEGRRLSSRYGLPFGQVGDYEPFHGTLKGKADLTSGSYAIVERAHDFVLVPWRDTLEKQLGKEISGVMRGRDIDWSFGRSRGLDIGM
jgi:type IV secretory pathway VirD2 relaxase